VKRRYKVMLGVAGVLLALAAAPILYVETQCGATGTVPPEAKSLLAPSERRGEARTWLTYPEWHIVYSAESLGKHLMAGRKPSDYPYMRDVKAFWRSTCAVNRIAAARPGGGDAKVMIYTIGLSFAAEMAIKAAWEKTVGTFFEWTSGHTSADDRHAALVQADYAAFMHQVPWYDYDFGKALSGLWATSEPRQLTRHWERRLALSMEYGVKVGYAKAIGAASGATLGRDELTLRFVTPAPPTTIAALDPRLKPIRLTADGQTVVEAPRYAVFSDLLGKMAAANIPVSDIAGNDEIFLTALLPPSTMIGGTQNFAMPLGDRPGWRRVGVTVRVADLPATMRAIQGSGGTVEHVHDY
jgi:hypothetical protein